MKLKLNIWMLILICAIMTKCSSDSTKSTNKVDSLTIKSDTNTKTTRLDIDTTKAISVDAQKDWMLLPGVSAGKTILNEDSKQAFKVLGRADGGDAAMGKSVAIWYSNHDSTANSIAIYTVRDTGDAPISLIKQIRVTSPRFKTQQGIHVGSTLKAIKQEFEVNQTEIYNDEGTTFKVYSSNKGIAFEMNPQNRCVAITIFENGKPLPGTYLKFRTTNKFIKNNN